MHGTGGNFGLVSTLVTVARAKRRLLLGWEPVEIGLIEDIETGGYTN